MSHVCISDSFGLRWISIRYHDKIRHIKGRAMGSLAGTHFTCGLLNGLSLKLAIDD